VFKPWARDANGVELETYYKISSSNIIQKINLDSENIAFPVVADPIWCGDTVRRVEWINRGDIWSASAYPTWCGAWGGQAWNSWEEAVDKTPNSRHWDKKFTTNTYWSMWDQYDCHVDFAKGAKTSWNLEPSKPDKSYRGFV